MNRAYLKRLAPDLRALILILPAMVVLAFIDLPVAKTLLFSVCGMLVLYGFSHWLRKLALPHFDWSEFAQIAKGSPVAAAIVVLAVAIMFSTFVIGSVLWVQG